MGVYGTDDELSLYCNLTVAVTISNGQTGTDRYGKIVTDREKEKNNIEYYIKLSEKMSKTNNVVTFHLII